MPALARRIRPESGRFNTDDFSHPVDHLFIQSAVLMRHEG